jgi:hypothetical protein
VAFLDAFMDRSVTAASPVNAVAVLSRADEIGAGRPDAMESSSKIAARYQADPHLSGLCAAVVPLAGLLAETGLTLREDEVASLRLLAATPPEELERMLLSADQFCGTEASQLTVEIRCNLLNRLGLFGVRLAVAEIAAGRATTAAALGPLLVEKSGLTALRQLISQHFMPRARVLQARSGLVALRSLARSLQTVVPDLASDIDRRLEQLESSTVQFAQVRAAHLVASGAVRVSATERAELDLLMSGPPSPRLVGLAPSAPNDVVQTAALAGISRWRTQAADPLADPTMIEVFDTATRVLEQVYSASL